jgi:hypothetical protein
MTLISTFELWCRFNRVSVLLNHLRCVKWIDVNSHKEKGIIWNMFLFQLTNFPQLAIIVLHLPNCFYDVLNDVINDILNVSTHLDLHHHLRSGEDIRWSDDTEGVSVTMDFHFSFPREEVKIQCLKWSAHRGNSSADTIVTLCISLRIIWWYSLKTTTTWMIKTTISLVSSQTYVSWTPTVHSLLFNCAIISC